jgi:hypothetical protein
MDLDVLVMENEVSRRVAIRCIAGLDEQRSNHSSVSDAVSDVQRDECCTEKEKRYADNCRQRTFHVVSSPAGVARE